MPPLLSEVTPILKRATDRSSGRWTVGALVDHLLSGQKQLWIAWRDGVVACAVTEILHYPGQKVCSIPFIAGGRMKEWLGFLPEIEKHARALGCVRMVAYDARNGAWLRVLEGWKRTHIEIEKEL